MPPDWRTACFRQARSDFETLRLLRESESVAFCQQLHYLQMATEKLGKGFTTPTDGPEPPRNHRAFVRFVQQVKRRPELQRVCDCGPQQIGPYIDSLLPLARTIEDLAPANANNGPNPEYPWQDGATVIAPVEYSFSGLRFDNRNMINMLKFIERCFHLTGTNDDT